MDISNAYYLSEKGAACPVGGGTLNQEFRLLTEADLYRVGGGHNGDGSGRHWWEDTFGSAMSGGANGLVLGGVIGAAATGSSVGFTQGGAIGAALGFSAGLGWGIGSAIYGMFY